MSNSNSYNNIPCDVQIIRKADIDSTAKPIAKSK